MPTDAFQAAPAGAAHHTHPWLTQETVDKAKTIVVTKPRNNRLPVVINEDSPLKCCGLKVSTLTPGAIYPNI